MRAALIKKKRRPRVHTAKGRPSSSDSLWSNEFSLCNGIYQNPCYSSPILSFVAATLALQSGYSWASRVWVTRPGTVRLSEQPRITLPSFCGQPSAG